MIAASRLSLHRVRAIGSDRKPASRGRRYPKAASVPIQISATAAAFDRSRWCP